MKFIIILFFITFVSLGSNLGAETDNFSSADEYLVTLERAVDKYERGEPLDVSITKLFFPSGKMQFVISYNFENPRVVRLLKKIQRLKVSDSLLYAIPDYLSGQQKQRDIALRRANPKIAKPVPNLDGGFFPADGLPKIKPDPMSAPLWMNESGETPPPGVPNPRLKDPDQSAKKVESDGKVEKQSLTPTAQKIQSTPTTSESTSSFLYIFTVVLTVMIVAGVALFIRRKSR